MSSVRKRTLPSGETRWLVDYRDPAGARRFKQFATKGEAVAYETKARAEVVAGTHVADSRSLTVSDAADLWIRRAELDELETSTVRQYRQHATIHIVPLIGSRKLSQLTRPSIEAFKDKLIETRSRAMARAVLASLKGILKEAQRRGLVGQNVAADVQVRMSSRDEEDVEIPTKDHIRALLNKSAELWPLTRVKVNFKGEQVVIPCSWRPLIVTTIFTGLRCSELRGLTWESVDFAAGVIRVRQRADLRNTIGPTKSKAGRRDVPMSPMVTNTLKAWKLACPVTTLDLVFPSRHKNIVTNGTIHRRCWGPLQKACGIVTRETLTDDTGAPLQDKDGKPVMAETPIYTFHALRHAAASLFIEQGWTPKKVQVVMGHSTIQMTFDTYGHLWPDLEDDRAALAQIEARLGLGS